MEKKHVRGLGLLTAICAVMFFGVACQPASPEVAELPTLMILPSFTPTNTPTNTPTPTPTPTHTLTPTPTNTLTPTNTFTFTPSATFTASITTTFTTTPTFTSTPTSTATNTPPATATPNLPQILSFTASATTVQGNSSVTLTWNAIADTARIDQLNQQGSVIQTFTVVPNGQLPVTVPGNLGRVVIYRLAVQRSGQEVTLSIPITILCSQSWFFGDQNTTGCPQAPALSGLGRFQQFERGYMVYVNANNMTTVYGLVNQNSQYISYITSWDGQTQYSCAANPPNELLPPKSIFMWTYCNTNAPTGSWIQTLGWGTSDLNTDDRKIQYEEGTGAFYIDSPIGVFRFSGTASGTWTKVT
jgi:hypothetical protein